MRITIDTKEDKPEEIKKAIELLNHVLGVNCEVIAGPSEGVFDIFGNNPTPEKPAEPSQPSQPADMFQAPQPELQKEDFNVGGYMKTVSEDEKAKKEIKPYF